MWANKYTRLFLTSDNDDGTIAGQLFSTVSQEVSPSAVIQVCVLQPQQRQLQGEAMALFSLPGSLYMNSPHEFRHCGIFVDLTFLQGQVHDDPVVEKPGQI